MERMLYIFIAMNLVTDDVWKALVVSVLLVAALQVAP